jgi:hypothetical protein
MQTLTATYSPEDNKLRLYPCSRLDSATYEREGGRLQVGTRQELFMAPMWTPAREDLLMELCAQQIGDEDTGLLSAPWNAPTASRLQRQARP